MNVKEYIDKMAVQLMNDDIWIIEYFITEKYTTKNREHFIDRVVNKYLTLNIDYVKISSKSIKEWIRKNTEN